MQRRTKLAIVIIIALILLGLGIYLLVSPYLAQKQAEQQAQTTTQLPSSPSAAQPSTANGQKTGTTAPVTAPVVVPSNPLLVLEHRAKAMVERIGSGTNTDGFLGYHDALLDATVAEQANLRAEQTKLIQDHPATGPRYGISTRGVASHVTQGKDGDAQVIVTVDAMQSIDAGDPRTPVSQQAKRILVSFAKQADGSYLVDSLTWSDVLL